MSALRLRGLAHAWPGQPPTFAGLDLEVQEGELVGIVGPSGAGKSTLLRVAGGLLPPTAGEVERSGRAAFGFQDPRLLPWRSVAGNLRFALDAWGVPRAEHATRLGPLLGRAGLDGLGDRLPAELSGGMAQRVSLVRALSLRPALLLLDEPFSAVDPDRREALHGLLGELLAGSPTAALLVTHDLAEAAVLCDRVHALRGGALGPARRPPGDRPRPPGQAWTPAGAAWIAELRGEMRGTA